MQSYGYIIVPQWTGYKNHVALGTTQKELVDFAGVGWNSVDLWCWMPMETDTVETEQKTTKKSKSKSSSKKKVSKTKSSKQKKH